MGLGTLSEYSRSRIPMPPQNRTTFIASPLRLCFLVSFAYGPAFSHHLDFRYGDHESAAPFANVRQLRRDLIPQIPGKDQDVIRPGLADSLRWEDRNVSAGQK